GAPWHSDQRNHRGDRDGGDETGWSMRCLRPRSSQSTSTIVERSTETGASGDNAEERYEEYNQWHPHIAGTRVRPNRSGRGPGCNGGSVERGHGWSHYGTSNGDTRRSWYPRWACSGPEARRRAISHTPACGRAESVGAAPPGWETE